ncbi:hypothetical protein MVEN_01864700 [Mycena venus]|uniref:CxC1-like cysteine cluster associated with KDZ transposases domain-containing protein n=1 Tax=Mycena venus TaxID=2733690 RepID=A0A8H6XIS6_9AGAR|nr:hypothetical protein MVEN_01864700 [Mycena venus]
MFITPASADRSLAIEDLEIKVCACAPVAVQLMQLGAFGCAPVLPSLAVDLRVLEFAMNLFVQISLNNTTFTNALERVLANMRFQLDHQNSLRCRFRNCLMWYTHLWNLLKEHYNSKLEKVREDMIGPQIITDSPSALHGRSAERPQSRLASSSGNAPGTRHRAHVVDVAPVPGPSTPLLVQQGNAPGTRRQAHVVDVAPALGPLLPLSPPPRATGKRAREPTPKPPPPPFPDPKPRLRPSEYLCRRCPACFANLQCDHAEEVDIMVCLDACFTQKKKKSPRDPQKTHPDTHFVPEHTAAQTEEYVDRTRDAKEKDKDKDKRRKRATVQEVEEEDGYEFERLPLPRSVLNRCEASFKAANEKREKASTEFFEDTALMGLLCRHDRVLWVHLPLDIRAGILYDVACSLERSCLKWGFLDRYMGRVAFAVSVFHAFRHEWACQLLYHPRKRVGFGFTNGEGCERFWKSIQHLITHLRICGYHNRLYTLDAQIEHTDKASRLRLGEWIARRYRYSCQKRAEATDELLKCGKSVELLREQWKRQCGQQAVNAIVLLHGTVKTRRAQTVTLMEKFVEAVETDDPNYGLYQAEWEAAEKALEKAESTLRRKEEELGVGENNELERLSQSEYTRDVMNARALKLRLRERLRARKFEFNPVEHTCRRLATDDKLRAHTESAIKRREPTITKIAAEYNKLCAKIAKHIETSQAPRGAIAPLPIPPNGLWQLDVDDAIFQDMGLQAIVIFGGLSHLTGFPESDVDKYHLQLHQDKLVRLCATWDKCLPDFGAKMGPLPPWGPSSSQLSKCRVDAHNAAHGEDRHYGEDNAWSDEEEESEGSRGEDEDFGIMEAVERADLYRNDENDN